MQQGEIIILVVIGLVIVVAIMVWLSIRRRRSDALRARFGDEYDRTVTATGHRGRAEVNLRERAERVAKLDIRPFTPTERSSFTAEWQDVKSTFVDSPPEAVLHADRLTIAMLQARGFPVGDFSRRHEDLTVNHAEIARHYMAGRDIAERVAAGKASTEEMRQAIKCYELVFEGLSSDVSDTVKHRPITMAATQRDHAA